jgi:putative component of membrane protein insertase Oxa1/YidC/SpoIIIJ protein YidD
MKSFLQFLIRAYQAAGFLWKPRCRFLPTCSHYALEALERHGAARGLALTLFKNKTIVSNRTVGMQHYCTHFKDALRQLKWRHVKTSFRSEQYWVSCQLHRP